jgi:C-terminal processing protease CtpA/Prc
LNVRQFESPLLRGALAVCAIGLASCSPIRIPPPPSVAPAAIGRTVSRDDARADIDVLMRTLENVHPNLYANRPRDSVALARERLIAGLPSSLSRSELWIRLAPFIAAFGDGHTNVAAPREEARRLQEAGALVFPPSVVVNDSAKVVVSVPIVRNAGVAAGDRLVSINGLSVDSLLLAWLTEQSGESEWFRAANVANSFRDLLLLHSIGAPYRVVTQRRDGARTIELAGIPQDSLRAVAARVNGQRTTAPNFTYELLPSHIGYMNFRTMAGDIPRFKADVAAMFQRVAADSARLLVVDLRGNGGGDSRLGEELLRYITTRPYRMSAAKEWKMSAEYRSYFKTWVHPAIRWTHGWQFFSLGRQLMNGPDGKLVTLPEAEETHSPAEPFFSPPRVACVLIGPQTFSSAVDLADAIKTYHLATLVGEETGGRPNGFGEAYVFRLPHSQLAVSVSSALFIRANGDTTDHRGVLPDFPAARTAEDRGAGRDPAIDRCRMLAETPNP